MSKHKFPLLAAADLYPHINYNDMEVVEAKLGKYLAEIERAYGGCHNCYGKGYATVNDRWIGYDLDTDIGSPGGTVSGGSPNTMKFCTCERGKQLKSLVADVECKTRVDQVHQDFQDYNMELPNDESQLIEVRDMILESLSPDHNNVEEKL